MNYTRPGRLHLIVDRTQVYATLWLFGWRLHFHAHAAGIIESVGW